MGREFLNKKDALIQGSLGGTQKMTVINESGLYSLVLSSMRLSSRLKPVANGACEKDAGSVYAQ